MVKTIKESDTTTPVNQLVGRSVGMSIIGVNKCHKCGVETTAPNGWSKIRKGFLGLVDVCPRCLSTTSSRNN